MENNKEVRLFGLHKVFDGHGNIIGAIDPRTGRWFELALDKSSDELGPLW